MSEANQLLSVKLTESTCLMSCLWTFKSQFQIKCFPTPISPKLLPISFLHARLPVVYDKIHTHFQSMRALLHVQVHIFINRPSTVPFLKSGSDLLSQRPAGTNFSLLWIFEGHNPHLSFGNNIVLLVLFSLSEDNESLIRKVPWHLTRCALYCRCSIHIETMNKIGLWPN